MIMHVGRCSLVASVFKLSYGAVRSYELCVGGVKLALECRYFVVQWAVLLG